MKVSISFNALLFSNKVFQNKDPMILKDLGEDLKELS